jgi:hypothetical protein
MTADRLSPARNKAIAGKTIRRYPRAWSVDPRRIIPILTPARALFEILRATLPSGPGARGLLAKPETKPGRKRIASDERPQRYETRMLGRSGGRVMVGTIDKKGNISLRESQPEDCGL